MALAIRLCSVRWAEARVRRYETAAGARRSIRLWRVAEASERSCSARLGKWWLRQGHDHLSHRRRRGRTCARHARDEHESAYGDAKDEGDA